MSKIDEVFNNIRPTISSTSRPETRAALRALFKADMERVIGEDEAHDIPPSRHPNSKPKYSLRASVINQEKARQRQRLAVVLDELFGKEKE